MGKVWSFSNVPASHVMVLENCYSGECGFIMYTKGGESTARRPYSPPRPFVLAAKEIHKCNLRNT